MKGTFFQNSIEFRLEVDGEAWHQGDSLSGKLLLQNRSQQTLTIRDLKLDYAEGNLKKVKAKDPQAFEILESITLEAPSELAANQKLECPWKLAMSANCLITDVSSSPYLYLRLGSQAVGHLQLNVQPWPIFEEFAQVAVLNDRFVIKHRKNRKSEVEFKLVPPHGKNFSSLESLMMNFSFRGDELKVQHVLTVKGIDSSTGTMKMKKTKETLEQVFSPTQYRALGGRLNPDLSSKAVEEIVGPYRNRGI